MQKVMIMLCSLCCCAYGMEQQSMPHHADHGLNNAVEERSITDLINEYEKSCDNELESVYEELRSLKKKKRCKINLDGVYEKVGAGKKPMCESCKTILDCVGKLEKENNVLSRRVEELEGLLQQRERVNAELKLQNERLNEEIESESNAIKDEIKSLREESNRKITGINEMIEITWYEVNSVYEENMALMDECHRLRSVIVALSEELSARRQEEMKWKKVG